MIHIQDKKDCCGCNACVQHCPKQCITMKEDSEGFLYPKIDDSLCIDCGLCNKVCPVINQGDVRQPIGVYAAKNPNEEIRRQSSSGGIFTMLAERIIDNGGVVFGAVFDEKWDVEHRYTETIEGIAAFRGSKYVQGRIGGIFKQAEVFLKQGRRVLFSGTPCQIAGLKLFLRKEYDNLITIDFICHGVPSPRIWQKYLEEKINDLVTEKSDIENVSFRDKSTGWSSYSFLITCNSDKVTHSELASKNPFMQGFLANLYLRPSCHNCPTKKLKSGSDLTLGDFWGIQNHYPKFSDDKGVSLVLINSEKGQKIFDLLKTENIVVTYFSALVGNPSIEHSVAEPKYRKEFFERFIEGTSVSKTVSMLTDVPFGVRFRRFVKQMIKKSRLVLLNR